MRVVCSGNGKVSRYVLFQTFTTSMKILFVNVIQMFVSLPRRQTTSLYQPVLMYLYLGNNPRVLYLVTSSHDDKLGRPPRSLVFRAGNANSQAVVEFLRKDEIDLANVVRLTSRVVKGCLGLISIEDGLCILLFCIVRHNSLPHLDTFLALVTSATEVGNTRPSGKKSESVARIHEVSFYSLTSSTWDDLPAVFEGLDGVDPINRETYTPPGAAPLVFEHPCMPLTKILSSGSFYYALDSPWDISSRLAVRLSRDPASVKDIGTFDECFVWNEYIVRSLLDFRERLDANEREDLDSCQFIVRRSH